MNKDYNDKSEVMIMRNEYNKGFEPNHDRIIAKAKEKNISVADVIALINM